MSDCDDAETIEELRAIIEAACTSHTYFAQFEPAKTLLRKHRFLDDNGAPITEAKKTKHQWTQDVFFHAAYTEHCEVCGIGRSEEIDDETCRLWNTQIIKEPSGE